MAPQYIASAEASLDNVHLHPFVESLWSGVELMAKAELVMTYATDLAGAKGSSHKAVQTRYNQVKKFGGVRERFAKLYNRLNELRVPARYLERKLDLTSVKAAGMLADARDMYRQLEKQAPKRELVDMKPNVKIFDRTAHGRVK